MKTLLKTLGVDGKTIVCFMDAYNTYPLIHSPRLKQVLLSNMLKTSIGGKTLIEHHNELVKAGIKEGLRVDKTHVNDNPRFIRESDFGWAIDNTMIQQNQIKIMLEHVLQKYMENFK